MGDFPATTRSSVERDRERNEREKSQSDERSISLGKGQKVEKVTKIEVEHNSPFLDSLQDYDLVTLGYQMRPKFGEKFSSVAVESVIESVLKDFFYYTKDNDKKVYSHDKSEQWVEQIGKELISKVRQLNYPRYKFVTHVTIGEHIGGGIHIGMKCMWDAETDLYATYTYLGDNLFCVGTVCGVYNY